MFLLEGALNTLVQDGLGEFEDGGAFVRVESHGFKGDEDLGFILGMVLLEGVVERLFDLHSAVPLNLGRLVDGLAGESETVCTSRFILLHLNKIIDQNSYLSPLLYL